MNDKQIKAADAQQLLDSPLFKGSFEKVGSYLEAQAISCNPDDKERAQRIIVSKQILAHIKREIVKVIEEGVMENHRISMESIEPKSFLKKLRR